jgi:carbonic anhydrase
MKRLISISTTDDILPEYIDTSIGLLLEYQNLKRPLDSSTEACLLIGMCMDNRIRLRIPDNFAYVIRLGGANLRQSEFLVSYAIAVGGIKSIAIIGHDNCGMVNLMSKKEQFIQGLVERVGWERQRAEEHFMHSALTFEIGNENDFVLSEAKRLRLHYPGVQVVPLLYQVEDNFLYLISDVPSTM